MSILEGKKVKVYETRLQQEDEEKTSGIIVSVGQIGSLVEEGGCAELGVAIVTHGGKIIEVAIDRIQLTGWGQYGLDAVPPDERDEKDYYTGTRELKHIGEDRPKGDSKLIRLLKKWGLITNE